LEFFDLTASSTIPFQNSYDMDGTGAGYSTSGVCLVSAQKRIGFALNELPDDSTNLVLRATMGSFINSKNKIGANTRGFKAPDLYINFIGKKVYKVIFSCA
jgi:hypothetical protein